MAIDVELALTLEIPEASTQVERGRLQFFAEATHASDPRYSDIGAAKSAGYPDLPVPPTYFFSLELDGAEPLSFLDALGVDLRQVLHGEQSFNYHAMAFAGDTVTMRAKIIDCYARRGGDLEFLVKRTEYFRAEQLIAEARAVIVIQHRDVDK